MEEGREEREVNEGKRESTNIVGERGYTEEMQRKKIIRGGAIRAEKRGGGSRR